MEYLRILGTENTAGGEAPGHEGGGRAHTPWVRPPVSWAHGGPPPLIPAPTHYIFFPKKDPRLAQARVLAHFAAIFDLLAQSSIHKTT